MKLIDFAVVVCVLVWNILLVEYVNRFGSICVFVSGGHLEENETVSGAVCIFVEHTLDCIIFVINLIF